MPARDDVPALQRTAETAERLLFVVVSRIRPEPAMGALQHLQWFDYRRQEPGKLEALATWLAVPGAKLREVVWKYKPLSDVSVPAAVSGAVGLLTIVSVIFLSVIAWTVGELAFSGEEEFGSWQQMVFPPIAGLVMAITAGGLRYRALSFRQLLGLLACVCVLIIAAEPGLGAIVAAIVAGFAAGLVHLRTWVLGRRLDWWGAGGLAVESSARGVLRWTAAVLVVAAVVALPLSREIWADPVAPSVRTPDHDRGARNPPAAAALLAAERLTGAHAILLLLIPKAGRVSASVTLPGRRALRSRARPGSSRCCR
jgi:hypothetical protein